MKIEFEITDIPNEEQKKYPVAYLEGILKIFVCNKIFFDQSGILLIEFAISLTPQLSNGNSIKVRSKLLISKLFL